jgi:hypothetical protein
MGRTHAILFTISTYGTWLRGDARGWVDDGIIFPADPVLEARDRARLKHDPYFFDRRRWHDVGRAMGESLRERLNVRIYALTIQSWQSRADRIDPPRHRGCHQMREGCGAVTSSHRSDDLGDRL